MEYTVLLLRVLAVDFFSRYSHLNSFWLSGKLYKITSTDTFFPYACIGESFVLI